MLKKILQIGRFAKIRKRYMEEMLSGSVSIITENNLVIALETIRSANKSVNTNNLISIESGYIYLSISGNLLRQIEDKLSTLAIYTLLNAMEINSIVTCDGKSFSEAEIAQMHKSRKWIRYITFEIEVQSFPTMIVPKNI